MNKFQKKQLLECVDVLWKAEEELKEQQPGSQKINLCADMQEFTLAMLNFLGNIDEEDEELTDCLSELYKMLLKASQDEIPSEQLEAQINHIKDHVEKKEPADN